MILGYSGLLGIEQLDFGEIYLSFSIQEEPENIKIKLAKGIHEVFKESESKSRNPFVFKPALI